MVLEQGALTGKFSPENPMPADSDRGRSKTICVFATSGGSGVSGSANDLKKTTQ